MTRYDQFTMTNTELYEAVQDYLKKKGYEGRRVIEVQVTPVYNTCIIKAAVEE